jgi:hypothetical protein
MTSVRENRRRIAAVAADRVRIAVAYLIIWSYWSAIRPADRPGHQRRLQAW